MRRLLMGSLPHLVRVTGRREVMGTDPVPGAVMKSEAFSPLPAPAGTPLALSCWRGFGVQEPPVPLAKV